MIAERLLRIAILQEHFILLENTSDDDGGGIYIEDSAPLIKQELFGELLFRSYDPIKAREDQ